MNRKKLPSGNTEFKRSQKLYFSGPEFGGAIGLMFFLANSIAVSMYLIGFCESLLDCMKQYGGIQGITTVRLNDIRIIGILGSILISLSRGKHANMFLFFKWPNLASFCSLFSVHINSVSVCSSHIAKTSTVQTQPLFDLF